MMLSLIDHVSSCVLIPNTTYNASEIFIRDRITDFDYARVGKYKKIYCCAQNYARITWEFKKQDGLTWQPFPWVSSLQDNNQTLQIIDIGWDNEGIYRCTAFSSENNVIANHSTEIDVYSCVDRVKPEVYWPKTQYGRVGGTASFLCTGDFGCTPDAARDVSWSKHTIIESTFEIITIEQRDFEKNFTCYVTSSYQEGNSQFIVQLKEARIQITNITWITAEEVTAIVVPSVIILTVAIVFTAVFYLRIKLFIFSRIPYWHLIDKGDRQYHVFILHEDEDTELARRIQQRLQSDAYTVKISGSMQGGTDMMQQAQEFAQDSKSLIIIYPSEYSKDSQNNNFQSLMGVRQYYSPNLVTVVEEDGRTGDKVEVIESDKTFVRIKYPPNQNCSTYKHDNFYCKLKLRMARRTEDNVCCTKSNGQTQRSDEDTELLNGQNNLSNSEQESSADVSSICRNQIV
ncbi:unnamed protein product [Mytilus coruscus]|uniref:Immunoglobulin domain-containing protein n=1 Tax=Mytilus coruscus TaxID=42192 RepID=A0A6J8E239_MYTCO|nr:unnamed protein product [Mytilus coruscus]